MPEPSRKGARLSHVGIALPTISHLLPFLRDVLQMPEADVVDSDGARIAAVAAGDTLVELLEPVAPDSPIEKYVRSRGAGIHHLCFEVDDLVGTLQRCREAGITLVDEVPRTGAEGYAVAFLHPKSTGGILIELTERGSAN